MIEALLLIRITLESILSSLIFVDMNECDFTKARVLFFLDKFYNCNTNCIFQGYLECLFQKDFTRDQLETELGEMMRIITSLMHGFMRMGLTREEYVCLQVILLLNQGTFGLFVTDGQSIIIVEYILVKYGNWYVKVIFRCFLKKES